MPYVQGLMPAAACCTQRAQQKITGHDKGEDNTKQQVVGIIEGKTYVMGVSGGRIIGEGDEGGKIIQHKRQ